MSIDVSFSNYNIDFINELKNKYDELEEILNFVSDKNHKVRQVMRLLRKSPSDYNKIIEALKRELLISCYTTSEIVFKEFIYCLLDYQKHENEHLNQFLKIKIDRERFSPNVTYKEIKKEIKRYFSDFSFIIDSNKQEIKSYDNLIKNRHAYAHNNSYDLKFEDFKEAIKVIEYIYFELYSVYNINESKEYIDILLTKITSLKEFENRKHLISKSKDLREIRNISKKFLSNNYNTSLIPELIRPIIDIASNFESLDLRKKESIELVNKQKSIIKEFTSSKVV
ncbi:hypothetical protein RM629_06545 [Staphylococcus chromogenes]|uniref:HEPN domain-containing protein n=1 Tax=Staphylococcus chromogenes TaxID=46126 RepID=UPI00288567FB|nr:HEPN domain-containing protein [Staphylococcus chromogenes]MDT0715888.1 hypothetical protein [Staphylococcus chromogenes]